MGNSLACQEESWDELINGKVAAMSPTTLYSYHS